MEWNETKAEQTPKGIWECKDVYHHILTFLYTELEGQIQIGVQLSWRKHYLYKLTDTVMGLSTKRYSSTDNRK
jgi:hypothetical protein